MITIMNLRKVKPSKPYDIEVCRGVSPLGNPYFMESEADRDHVCDSYVKWIEYSLSPGRSDRLVIDELLRLKKLYMEHGKLRLFCWCVPKRCHAETIKEYIEEAI